MANARFSSGTLEPCTVHPGGTTLIFNVYWKLHAKIAFRLLASIFMKGVGQHVFLLESLLDGCYL